MCEKCDRLKDILGEDKTNSVIAMPANHFYAMWMIIKHCLETKEFDEAEEMVDTILAKIEHDANELTWRGHE